MSLKENKTAYPLLYLVFIFFLAVPAISQQSENTKTPSWLLLSLEQRTRFEYLTNPFRMNTTETEKHLPLRTRLRLGLGEPDRPVRFVLELQDSRVLIDREILSLVPAHINELDFLQAHLQFNLDPFPSRGLRSQFVLGRFTMDLGKRRLTARNSMRNTTNAFDGISWALAGNPTWRMQTFFTRPVLINPEKLDSSWPAYFWGIFFETKRFPEINTDLYYLGLYSEEQNPVRPRFTTIGGRFYKTSMPGTIHYEVETVWQFGKSGDQDHFAYFQHAEMGYSFKKAWNPGISLQYDYASGDNDPEDNRSGRFSTLFGARRFDFNPTGIYGPFYRSNINTPGIRIVLNPVKELQIMAAHRGFWLASAKDAWVGSGFQDLTGNSGKSLGQNFELRILWKTNSNLTVECGYARFFKGSYLDRVPRGPGTEGSNFFYISTEVSARLLPY